MAKTIKLFRHVQKFHHIAGIYPPSEHHGQHRFDAKTTLILVYLILFFISSFVYFLFVADSIDEYGQGFSASGGKLEYLLYFVVNLSKVESILSLIKKLEEFIEMRAYNSASTIVLKIDKFSEGMYQTMMGLTLLLWLIPAICLGLINYYIMDMKDESFDLPSPMVLPYDWKTPLSYLITMIAIFLATIPLLMSFLSSVCFFVGICMLFISFMKDLTDDLGFLNVGSVSTNERRMKMKQRFCKIIQNYMDVKEFVDEFNSIYEYTFFVFFVTKLMFVCSSLILLSIYISNHVNPLDLFNSITGVIWTFVTIFAVCELGEKVTHHFNIFHHELCNCDWFLFPIEMQRIYLLVLVGAQQSTVIQGYANTTCTRDTFKNTVNGGFTYFTMLQRMDG